MEGSENVWIKCPASPAVWDATKETYFSLVSHELYERGARMYEGGTDPTNSMGRPAHAPLGMFHLQISPVAHRHP